MTVLQTKDFHMLCPDGVRRTLLMVLTKGAGTDCAAYMTILPGEDYGEREISWTCGNGAKMREKEAAGFFEWASDGLTYRK